ncbi:MAG: SUMF1/EgtB/PvdO family nonheme iron enzyme, partial [Bacteriovoracaceae bacterium]
WIEPFLLSSHLVTNGEYLNFIHDNGYRRREFWSAEGFHWVNENNIKRPLYWIERDGEYREFSLYGDNPLNLESPVSHVSFYEAQAYANYMQSRLPTEAEWELASLKEPLEGHFLEDEFYLPDVAQDNYQYFSQIHGTLWEWTSSSYAPYPRFLPYGGDISEYNSKFMNQQYVLRGGSCITPQSHYRRTYRNYYYPQMRWQFCGIRLAKDKL